MNVYSTTNIAVVARDLGRHPFGAGLALDLLHALALDEAAMVHLDAAATVVDVERRRAVARARAAAEPRALATLAAARTASQVAGLAAWTASLPVLEQAPMGGADLLLRWLRDDVLGWAWDRDDDLAVARHPHALDVVADGILATWVGDDGPLGTPWRRWASAALPATVTEPAVAALVAMVAASEPAALAAAADAIGRARASGWSWSLAMHDACWAVELTGRGRTAAIAQLDGVRAIFSVVARPRPDAVAAVIAAVHATVVADVLPATTVAAMCRPLLGALG